MDAGGGDVNQPIRIIIPVPPRRFAEKGKRMTIGHAYDPLCVFMGPPRTIHDRLVAFRFCSSPEEPMSPTCFMAFYYMYASLFHLTRAMANNPEPVGCALCATFCVLSVPRSVPYFRPVIYFPPLYIFLCYIFPFPMYIAVFTPRFRACSECR